MSQHSNYEPRKVFVNGDQQMNCLRNKILNFFPQMEVQVLKMDKSDLLQILELAQKPQHLRQAQIKDMMVKQILKMFPDMANQLSVLDQNDIKQIYNQIMGQSGPVKVKTEAQHCSFPKKLPTPKPKPRTTIIRGPDGEINVYEMKKTLTQRLPQFRNQIRNLPDEQIKSMFRELQQQQNRRRQSERKIKKNNQPFVNETQGVPQSSQQQNYPHQQFQPYYPNYQNLKSIPLVGGYRGEAPPYPLKNMIPPPTNYFSNYSVYEEEHYQQDQNYPNIQYDYYQAYHQNESQNEPVDQAQPVTYYPEKSETKNNAKELSQEKKLDERIKLQRNIQTQRSAIFTFNNGIVAQIKFNLQKQNLKVDENQKNCYKDYFDVLVKEFSSNNDCEIHQK